MSFKSSRIIHRRHSRTCPPSFRMHTTAPKWCARSGCVNALLLQRWRDAARIAYFSSLINLSRILISHVSRIASLLALASVKTPVRDICFAGRRTSESDTSNADAPESEFFHGFFVARYRGVNANFHFVVSEIDARVLSFLFVLS